MHTFVVRHLAVAFGAASLVGLSACGSEAATELTVEPTPPPVTAGPLPAGSLLPTGDAGSARDELLQLAAAADPLAAGGYPDTAILSAWLEAVPALQLTVFPDVPANEQTVSASSAFLISQEPGVGDQLWGFAVADTDGGCAGAVAVIDGNPDGSVSDADEISSWHELDDLAVCSATAAIEAYAGV